MDINFELYKIFYHAAKNASFSEAARELFISQSAVSQSVKGLEDSIGSRLFIRGPRSIKLTATGELLFSYVEQAYSLLKSAEHKIEEMQNLHLGELKIGVGDTVLRYFLTPYLQQFIKKYPEIKVQIINRTTPGIIATMKKGEVDFGIITLPTDDLDIETTLFREVRDVFVASPRFSRYVGKPIDMNELLELPLLLLQKQSATRRNLDSYFSARDRNVIPEIELESMELLVEYARIGLGVAYVLKESADALVSGGELFILEQTDPIPKRKLGIATLRNVPLSKAAAEFAADLRSTANKT